MIQWLKFKDVRSVFFVLAQSAPYEELRLDHGRHSPPLKQLQSIDFLERNPFSPMLGADSQLGAWTEGSRR